MVKEMALPMVPTTGKGKELMELLRRELGIPLGVQWFEVRFAMSEAVRVKLEYTPRIQSEPDAAAGEGAGEDAT